MDFPGGPAVKNPPANAGNMDSIPGRGGSHMPWSNEVRVPQLLTPEHSRARAPQEKPPQWGPRPEDRNTEDLTRHK